MTYNFLRGDRDQPFLQPPDLRDWLPQEHLAWFILDVVDQVDLQPFYRAHRDDGHGHPAWDPAPPVLLADAAYGEVGQFRLGLKERELASLVQVPGTISAYPPAGGAPDGAPTLAAAARRCAAI